jgi:hypothetical protein
MNLACKNRYHHTVLLCIVFGGVSHDVSRRTHCSVNILPVSRTVVCLLYMHCYMYWSRTCLICDPRRLYLSLRTRAPFLIGCNLSLTIISAELCPLHTLSEPSDQTTGSGLLARRFIPRSCCHSGRSQLTDFGFHRCRVSSFARQPALKECTFLAFRSALACGSRRLQGCTSRNPVNTACAPK